MSRNSGSYRVAIAHPTVSVDGVWIDDFVKDDAFSFYKVRPFAPCSSLAKRWLGRFGMGFRALRGNPDVVVASFPHLALTTAFWKMVTFRRTKVVAWYFNIPPRKDRLSRWVISTLARGVDLFVVHSRIERRMYANLYGIDRDKIVFMPYQQALSKPKPIFGAPETPYLIAMGSMSRDYQTLADAIAGTNHRLLLIADWHAVAGVDLPENVELRNGIPAEECLSLASGAAAMVLPIARDNTASGHITLVTGMMLGIPVVATDSEGLSDYIENRKTALTVPAGDSDALRAAIAEVVSDTALAQQLSTNSQKLWEERFSDSAAAKNLAKVLHSVLKPADASERRLVPAGY